MARSITSTSSCKQRRRSSCVVDITRPLPFVRTAGAVFRSRPRTMAPSTGLLLVVASLTDTGTRARIDWPQTAITSLHSDQAVVALVAKRHFGYHTLSSAERAALARDLVDSGVDATVDQAVCVRNLLYKLQLDTQRERLEPRQLAKAYAEVPVVAGVSRRLHVPPLEVMRAALPSIYGLSPVLGRKVVEHAVAFVAGDGTTVHNLGDFCQFLQQSPALRRLPAYTQRHLLRFSRKVCPDDWEQLIWACLHDMQGTPKQRTLNDAERVERLLEAHLRQRGVDFRSEQDLRAGQDAAARRSTPDVVFAEPQEVCGGARVVWMDVKRMYGTVSCGPASDALLAQLVKTATKYQSDWGPGAFVFKFGYCEALAGRLREEVPFTGDGPSLLSAAALKPP